MQRQNGSGVRLSGINLKATYDIRLNDFTAHISTWAKNIFNSYQKDLDQAPLRDAGYVCGHSRVIFMGIKLGNLYKS